MFRTHISLDNTDQILDFYKNYDSNKNDFIIKDDKVYKKKWYDFFFLKFESFFQDTDNSKRLGDHLKKRVVEHVTLNDATEKNVNKVNDFFQKHQELKSLVITDTFINDINRTIGSNFDEETSFDDFYYAKKNLNQLANVYKVVSKLEQDDPLNVLYQRTLSAPLSNSGIKTLVTEFNTKTKDKLKQLVHDKSVSRAVELAAGDTELLAIYISYLEKKPLNRIPLRDNIKDYYYKQIGLNITNQPQYLGYFDSDRQHVDEVFSPLLERKFGGRFKKERQAFTAHVKLQQRKGADEVRKLALEVKSKDFMKDNLAVFKYLNILDDLIEDASKIKEMHNISVDFQPESGAHFIAAVEGSMKNASKLKTLAGVKVGLSAKTKAAITQANDSQDNLTELLALIEKLSNCDDKQLKQLKADSKLINGSAPFKSFLATLKDEEAGQFFATLKPTMTRPLPLLRELGSFTREDSDEVKELKAEIEGIQRQINLLRKKESPFGILEKLDELQINELRSQINPIQRKIIEKSGKNFDVGGNLQLELEKLHKDVNVRRKTLIEAYNALANIDLEKEKNKEKEAIQFIELVKEVRAIKPYSENRAKQVLRAKDIESRQSFKTVTDVESFLFKHFGLTGQEPLEIENFNINDETTCNILEKYFAESATAYLNGKGAATFNELKNREAESVSKAKREEALKLKLTSIEKEIKMFTADLEIQMATMNAPSFVGPRFLNTKENQAKIVTIRESIAALLEDKGEGNVERERELMVQMKGFQQQIKDYR